MRVNTKIAIILISTLLVVSATDAFAAITFVNKTRKPVELKINTPITSSYSKIVYSVTVERKSEVTFDPTNRYWTEFTIWVEDPETGKILEKKDRIGRDYEFIFKG